MQTNPHLARTPRQYGASLRDAGLVVYAVHGRGQSPDFMAEIADRVNLPGTAWVLPAAHNHSWYPQSFLSPIEENQPALDDALETVRSQLDALRRRNGPPVVVLGFSQGACLLSEYLLQEQPNVAGAVLHTGGYLGPSERMWDASSQANINGLPVQMFTSQEDAWVPVHRVKATSFAFRALGAAVDLTIYDDPDHHVNDDSICVIRRYLRHCIVSSIRL